MRMLPPLLELRRVSVVRGGRLLVRSMDWVIRRGERWALIGPSGSGKTSLVEVLAGIRRPRRGRVFYSFTEEDAPSDRDVILVSAESQMRARAEISPFYQARWNSAEEETSATVRHFLSAMGIYAVSEFHLLSHEEVPAEFRELRRQVVEATGVAPLLGRRLMDLSNGELRKVLIARALAQRPQLLILDDPLSGLDAESRKSFHRVLDTAVRMGISIVFVAATLTGLPPGCATHVKRLGGRGAASRSTLRKQRARRRTRLQRDSQIAARATAAAPGDVAIAVSNASVRYGSVRVLNAVSWQVRFGERWAVLGPNGSGKTTLLGLITGDHPQAYACDIRILGRARGSGESIWEIKENIGHVAPEVQAFLPADQTGTEIVCSGFFDSIGLWRPCPAAMRRAAAGTMRELGIWALSGRRLAEMSAGEQRLVLVARALVKQPPILILDEPCQALDPETRRRILALVDELALRRTMVLVVVAHKAVDLPRSITHVLRLNRGRATIGKPRALHSSTPAPEPGCEDHGTAANGRVRDA